MYSQTLIEKLDFLRQEGERLVEIGDVTPSNWFAVRTWYSSVGDILEVTLPEKSRLLAQFQEISSPDDLDVSEPRQTKNNNRYRADLVQKINQILVFAKLEIVPTLQSKTFDELNKERENYINEIDRDVRTRITDEYFKTWWFRFPILVLFLAISFATLGVIQINNYRLSMQEVTAQAIEQAKQDIVSHTTLINSQLDEFAKDRKADISQGVSDRIDDLAQELAPGARNDLPKMEARVELLEPQVKSLEERQGAIQDQVEPLEKALEDVRQNTDRELWFDAVAIINNILIVVGVPFLISSVALIVSLLTFWRSRRMSPSTNKQSGDKKPPSEL